MAKFWTTANEKIAITIGMFIMGYATIASTFEAAPALPEIVSRSLVGSVSITTIAAGLTLYGIYMLWSKY